MAVGDRTVAVRLLAEVSGYVSGMNQAALSAWRVTRQTETVGKSTKDSMDGAGKSAGRFGSVMAGLGGIIAIGFAAKAIGAMMDFEDAMARLGAASMATASELETMRGVALKAGQDTVFTATEAADAMTELAKAGVSTADIIGGALDGALALAAAGELDVAEAAETAATAMVQFGLSGEDVTHIADLLAAGAGKAQGSVHDLGMALRQGGQVASMMGWTLEETTTALTAFAAAGLLGSDAGTSLKTMLLRLANPSNEAKNIMAQLGLNVYDASGNMLGATEMAGALSRAFGNLDPQARNAAMAIIFGTDATRAANVLYQQGEAGIRDWSAAVDDAGYAAEVAAKKNDTLRGDLNRLRGTVDSLVNTQGRGLNSFFRELVQGLDSALKALNEWDAASTEVWNKAKQDAGFDKEDVSLMDMYVNLVDRLKDAYHGWTWGTIKQAEATDTHSRAMDAWAARLEGGADAYRRYETAQSTAASGAEGMQGALEASGLTAEEAAARVDELTEALLGLGGQAMSVEEAQDDLSRAILDAEEPVRDLEAAVAELERTRGTDEEAAAAEAVAVARAALEIEGNSDAALTNRDRLRDLATQGKTTAGEFYSLTGDVAGTTAEVQRARDKFVAAATAMYATHYPAKVAADKANELANKYGLIPGDVSTIIHQYGADTAIAQARTLRDTLLTLDGTTARTRVVNVTETHRVTYADYKAAQVSAADGGWVGARGYPTGGWVSGPGGPRTDSIPAWLSNGEFVVNAHSASMYGPLLEAINRGQAPAAPSFNTYINATTESIVAEIRRHDRMRSLMVRQAA